MRFRVLRLRLRGRPLPRRDWQRQPAVVGDLRVEQLYDDELLRHLRLARLVDIGRSAGPDALPALYDPVLVAMSPQAFTLMGFERVEGAEYAQSWWVALP